MDDTVRHKMFLQALARSQKGVFRVAQWFNKQGKDIYLPGLKMAPTRADFAEYSDDGDMFVRHQGEFQRVEVKWIGAEFSGYDDWPFPDYIVCSKSAYDRSKVRPAAIICLSKSGHSVGVVRPDTYDQWTARTIPVRKFEMEQVFYTTSVESVDFYRVGHDSLEDVLGAQS